MANTFKGQKINLLRFVDKSTYIMILGIVLLSFVINIFNPKFLTVSNLTNILQQVSISGVLAAGMTMVIITGGIDLSAGYGVTFGVIVIGNVFLLTNNPWISMLSGLIACMVLGLINGIIISKFKVIPFITTLATMLLTQGILNLMGAGKRLQLKDPIFEYIGRTKFGGIALTTFVMIIFMIIYALMLNRTKLGGYTYAIGSNEGNARTTGINVELCKTVVYTLSGLSMGLSAILLGSRTVLVTQNSGGTGLLMDTIAAVILGGTSTAGGVGTMLGTFIGVIMLGIISNALTLLNIPAQSQELFKGILIIAILLSRPLSNMFHEWKIRKFQKIK